MIEYTSIISTSNSPKSLLTCGIPNLQLAYETINLMSFESEIDSDGRKIIFNKVTVAKPQKERRLADSLIANNDHLEGIVVLLNHVYL